MQSALKIDFSEWLERVVRGQDGESVLSPLGEALPDFPDDQLQRNTTGLSGRACLEQASSFYEDLSRAIEKEGASLTSDHRVLDFGMGWGRIARFFLREIPLSNLYGIDVDADFVELANKLFHFDNFSVCSPLPTTSFGVGTLDLVSAYSVFSHLSEEACTAWVDEFSRLIRPGGFFAFTTRHEDFLTYCEWASTQIEGEDGYLRSLGELFPDIDAARSKYRSGEIVHATSPGVSGGGARDESFYGETFIPRAYVERTFCRDFRLVQYSYAPERYDQACFVLRRIG